MPRCSSCKRRIDLSYTGIRSYFCSKCKKPTCKDHFDFERGICFRCAGIQISKGKCAFSFVRKDALDSKTASRGKK
jgi:hypothetical protein